MESYHEELQRLHHRRVSVIAMGGGVIMLLFALLDYLTVPNLAREFLVYRVAGLLFGVVLFFINRRDTTNAYPFIIGFTAYLLMALVLMVMIYRMGGFSSPYYVGLILAFTLYVTLAPLTYVQSLAVGGVTAVCYLITVILAGTLSSLSLVDLFSNMFFFVCFVFIVATQCWTETAARRSEYRLRVQESRAAEALADQALLLEREVEKRSREQTDMEKRYHQLFDQLADEVVMIDARGTIVQSNMTFDSRFGRGVGRSFFDLVDVRQQAEAETLFAGMIASRRPITAARLFLLGRDGNETEVEVNGNVIERGGEVEGILLIIRDLTTRKMMERKLIESLEIKKETETSAILVLAKLSEFKDLTPPNHLERVREYCRILAMQLAGVAGLGDVITPTYIEDIYHGSILHDIGKVAIPDEYMAGDAPLEEYERDYLRRHTLIGGDVIREMEEESEGSGFLSMAKHIAYFHHERWDGKGYPYGLAGREIPLAARIMAVADTYEELTANPGGMDHAEAIRRIEDGSGSIFDPMVVKAFLNTEHVARRVIRDFPPVLMVSGEEVPGQHADTHRHD